MTFDSSKAAVAARDDLVSRWTADARAANLPQSRATFCGPVLLQGD